MTEPPSPGPEVYAEGIRDQQSQIIRLANRVAVYEDFAYVVRNGYDVAKAVSILDAALAKIT